MENNNKIRDLYEIYLEQGHEVFEEKIKKPMELYRHASSNVISMNSLNTMEEETEADRPWVLAETEDGAPAAVEATTAAPWNPSTPVEEETIFFPPTGGEVRTCLTK